MSDRQDDNGAGKYVFSFLGSAKPVKPGENVRYARRDLKSHFGDLESKIFIYLPTDTHLILPLLRDQFNTKIFPEDVVLETISKDADWFVLKATRYSKRWKGMTRIAIKPIYRRLTSIKTLVSKTDLGGLHFFPPSDRT